MITTAQCLEMLAFEIAMIESVITWMVLRKRLHSADSKLLADDLVWLSWNCVPTAGGIEMSPRLVDNLLAARPYVWSYPRKAVYNHLP